MDSRVNRHQRAGGNEHVEIPSFLDLRGQRAVVDERLAERHVLAPGEAAELRLHFVDDREVDVLHPLDLYRVCKVFRLEEDVDLASLSALAAPGIRADRKDRTLFNFMQICAFRCQHDYRTLFG